jgi:hypothetical protein
MKNMIKNFDSFNESFEGFELDFIKDCYLDLQDLGFEFSISSNSISGELLDKYSFEEVIESYRNFILVLQVEFTIKTHNIKFTENKVIINVELVEKSLEGLVDSVAIKLNGEEKIFKIIKISRNMIDVNKKTYLVGIRFFMENSDSEAFIDFNVYWELNWKEVNRNVKNSKRAFINPNCDFRINNSWFRLTGRGIDGQVEVDEKNAEKFYQYFKNKGGGWRFGNDENGTKVDFTTQFSPKDLVGNWNT